MVKALLTMDAAGELRLLVRRCQSNANPSLLFADERALSHEKVAPFTKSDVAFCLNRTREFGLPLSSDPPDLLARRFQGSGVHAATDLRPIWSRI